MWQLVTTIMDSTNNVALTGSTQDITFAESAELAGNTVLLNKQGKRVRVVYHTSFTQEEIEDE